jgi:hypothetical protein
MAGELDACGTQSEPNAPAFQDTRVKLTANAGSSDLQPTRRSILSDTISATHSGCFKIAGEATVARLGFGTMRLRGPGIWGGPDRWTPLGRPEYLIQQAYNSCRNLGVERIDLWQLHRIDPKVPRDEQFDAVKLLLDTGVIRYAGLSEVTVKEIVAASTIHLTPQEFSALDTGRNLDSVGD